MQSVVCLTLKKAPPTTSSNAKISPGLKDHVLPQKRLSSVPQGTQTQLGKLSKRKQEEEALDQSNYLHPKKPTARMSKDPCSELYMLTSRSY